MNKIGFLFYGRLEVEKGFDSILQMIEIFGNNNQDLPFDLYIFGKGKLESDLIKLTHKYNSIHFFGRQTLDYIKQYLPKVQYLLMPSSFLETFGLSALNSLSRGLPVIGFAKGGLAQFILPAFDLTNTNGFDTAWKLHNMINKLVQNPPKLNPKTFQEISDQYSKEIWFQNFKKIFGSGKKILMLSDFKSKIGGIETYIYDVKDLLESKGYEIQVLGCELSSNRFAKFFKYLGILLALVNISNYFKIQKAIKEFNPDILRYHSTLRWIGRLGISASKKFKGKKIVMYHDFGYFYPFPHSLHFVDQIKTPLTLINYIKSAKTNNPIKILAISFKYLSVSLIKKSLKKYMDKHLSPSEFMLDIISNSYQLTKKKIKAFPHFIQE
ncbi:glycosyltransferase [Candidatus Gracilibacteria bacterium]|nr:glycosyltransferase [Candidatus Gracilibacteria bacterium]